MIKVLQKTKGKIRPIKDLNALISKKYSLKKQTWIDIDGESEELLGKIGGFYNLHHLAIEDCKTLFHLPKIDYYPGYFFLVFHSFDTDKYYEGEIIWKELDIFFGKNFLITFHRKNIPAIEKLLNFSNQEVLKENLEDIFYYILDQTVDEYLPYMDRVYIDIDNLEDTIIKSIDSGSPERIINIKRKLLNIRKIISLERSLILDLSERSYEFFIKDMRFYFMDIYDHLFQVLETLDTYREILSGSMDIYLSSVSNKMNEIMKVLTIIATIILPLTLITGIYGMNFHYMPELYFRYGYYIILILMSVITLIFILFFKRKKWF